MIKTANLIIAICISMVYVFYPVQRYRNGSVRNLGVLEETYLQEKLLSGDFTHLEEEYRDFGRSLEASLKNGYAEWRQIDLNGDGIDDFILQDVGPVGDSEEKRIVGIFTVEGEIIRCIEIDLMDGTEYSFCGATGELMYTAPNYGGIIDSEPYEHYYYDLDWNKVIDYKLQMLRLDSEVDEDLARAWKKENPDMAEDGVYYFRCVGDEKMEITEKEFREMYEAEMGFAYVSFQ